MNDFWCLILVFLNSQDMISVFYLQNCMHNTCAFIKTECITYCAGEDFEANDVVFSMEPISKNVTLGISDSMCITIDILNDNQTEREETFPVIGEVICNGHLAEFPEGKVVTLTITST